MRRKSISPLNTLLSVFGVLVILILFGAGMCAAIRQNLQTRLRWEAGGRKPARA